MDLCFANNLNYKSIQCLYPVYQFQVNVSTLQTKNVVSFNFCLEKLNNMIQLRISDINEGNKMYLCTIDATIYQEIKTEQSLSVDFHGFITHLVTILDCCKKNELHIALVENKENTYVLQFYEKRSLKNLIHLFLRVQEASPAIIMYHMNITLTKLKDETSSLINQNNFLQNEVNKRDFHIQESQAEIEALKNKIIEKENIILHRNTEEIKRLNQEIKNIEVNKEFEENRMKAAVKAFETKIEKLTKDNFESNEKLLWESKKSEALKFEIDEVKRKLCVSNADNELLKNNIKLLENNEKQDRKKINDMKKQIDEIEEKLRLADKEKSNLHAEIEAEKKNCSTKKRALQIATDELGKSQEILKQKDLLIEKLKKGIDWRSLVLFRMNIEVEKYRNFSFLKN